MSENTMGHMELYLFHFRKSNGGGVIMKVVVEFKESSTH